MGCAVIGGAVAGAAGGAAGYGTRVGLDDKESFNAGQFAKETALGGAVGAIGGAAGKAIGAATSRIGGGGSRAASGARSAASACSFSGSTTVLMADGEKKPINKVQVGDKVQAVDPETGERAAKPVLTLFKHRDLLVDLKIGKRRVTTTEDHPFWNATDRAFQRADQLDVRDRVLTGTTTAAVTGIDWRSVREGDAYNLEIADIHTYQVGTDAILVHNTGDACGTGAASTASQISGQLWTSTGSKSGAQNALAHFNSHKADFPHLNNSLEYVAEAQSFLRSPLAGTLSRVRGNGDVVRYNPQNNNFGVMDSSGAPRTYFKPDISTHGYTSNLDYFNAQ